MSLALSIGILILATAGALIAFFGETLRKDETGFPRRVTKHGSVAIALLIASLLLGIVREFRNSGASRADANALAESKLREITANGQLENVRIELAQARVRRRLRRAARGAIAVSE